MAYKSETMVCSSMPNFMVVCAMRRP